jgi:hypothetical protein
MVILGLVFLLFLFFFSIMFLLALGSQGMRETIEEERQLEDGGERDAGEERRQTG